MSVGYGRGFLPSILFRIFYKFLQSDQSVSLITLLLCRNDASEYPHFFPFCFKTNFVSSVLIC